MEELEKTVKKFKIADNTSGQAKKALEDKRFSDFEDALQFYAAKAVATVLVTRNERDFIKVSGEIEVLTPEEFVRKHM